jgi:DNA-binding transcriptional LysR family regulator
MAHIGKASCLVPGYIVGSALPRPGTCRVRGLPGYADVVDGAAEQVAARRARQGGARLVEHPREPGLALELRVEPARRLRGQVLGRRRPVTAAPAGRSLAAMPAGLEGFRVIRERLVAAVPADHPLTRHKRVILADLTAHPLVCMPEGSGIRTVFDRGCAARGVRPYIALQASAPDTIADLAARGLGVAILSASMVDVGRGLRGLQIADLDAPALPLVWKATDTPALREIVRYCRAAFA